MECYRGRVAHGLPGGREAFGHDLEAAVAFVGPASPLLI